jgi:hypothetical protein
MKHVTQGCRRKKTPKATGGREQAKPQVNGETLRSAVTWIVNEKSFENLKFHGNTTWRVCDLIILAVLWVWSDHATLTGAFVEAHGWSLMMLGRAAVGSYQGLTGALVSVTSTLLPLLWERMHVLMERHGGESWRVVGWLPLAVDGSRVSTPRTAANEQAFCAPNYGRSASAKHRAKKRRKKGVPRRQKKSQPARPQIWLTLVWHMGLRLLWCWRTGPSNSSERAHFQDLLKTGKFPEQTLFCGDAGFVGYEFWSLIAGQGHHFLMRVGSNVTLLRKLGYARESHGIVYCWPSKAARKKQPPLVLRLIALKLGRTPIYLVTNVLDPRELPNAAASQLYQLRWGIELQFRTIKQTFGRSKLRSKTPERALRELDWSLLGLWMIQLFAVKEQLAIGQPPTRSSAALAIHAIRDVFHHWSEIPTRGTSLKSKLQHAVTDQYQRTKKSKMARYRPNNKDKPHAGKPILINATRQHKHQLKQYLALAV